MIAMRPATLDADKADRAKAAAGAVAINLLLGTALLTGLALHFDRVGDASLATFDVRPPQPPPVEEARRAKLSKLPSAPAGKRSESGPIVAPPAKLTPPVTVAAIPGVGTAPDAGAAGSGSGTGAGGEGSGQGAGGIGDGGGRTGAVLISGRLTNRDYRAIAGPDLPSGSAMYVLLVNPAGRVERCRVAASSGSDRVDQWFCSLLSQRMTFRPAMEADGRRIYQDVNYVARWGR